MTRRNFLEMGALAAAGFALTPFRLQGKTEQVIIIGSGIAGLAAWEALKNDGVDALIIEAGSRVGGRVHTSRELINGKPVELGAAWIHGAENNLLWERVQKQKLGTKLVREETEVVFDINGEVLTVAAQANKDKLFEDLLGFLEKRRESLTRDRPLQDLVEEFIQRRKLNARERRRLAHSVESSVTQEYAESPVRLSGKNWNVDEGFQGGDATVLAGLDSLFPRGYRIRLNQTVTKIEHKDDLVLVTTDRDVYQAKTVICTVPLSILQSDLIEFVPPLADSKRNSIARLGFGRLEKVILSFPRRFWPDDCDLFGLMGEERIWSEWFDGGTDSTVPTLIGYAAGQKADSVAGLSEKEAVALAIKELSAIFGEVPDPDASTVTSWSKNPHIQGAYTAYVVGSGPEDVLELAKPHGTRLMFAGEATAAKAVGTLHGAAASGYRAAMESIALL